MGVLVVMNEEVHLASHVYKSDSQLHGAFRSLSGGQMRVQGGVEGLTA